MINDPRTIKAIQENRERVVAEDFPRDPYRVLKKENEELKDRIAKLEFDVSWYKSASINDLLE